MKNFVVESIPGGITEMDIYFVIRAADSPVHNRNIFFLVSALDCSYNVPSFLAVGRNP